ncbi:hypothetical protein PRUPE_5G027100 [Prunus persica]|uniref:Major facilitator superfamily (MFS) profile domain-containing protein n=1 Tax=Prunus persica TaxID=3760 RepID=M5WLJ5_PRUPE|nr:putative polyol transporter 1 [Prunus persica]ONI05858.1 hypothetical protein PRUPE_5G027100 [Prunus persica]
MTDHRAEANAVSGQPLLKKKPKRNLYAIGCAILASMTSILLGYDIGVMSGASIYIQEDLKITDVEVEILIGILNLYSLIGSAAAGRTSDWIGRRYTIVFAGAIFFTGALLMGFATNFAFLMVGRFVAGIGVGYALMIAPVYNAEVSPASSRGALTSFPEVESDAVFSSTCFKRIFMYKLQEPCRELWSTGSTPPSLTELLMNSDPFVLCQLLALLKGSAALINPSGERAGFFGTELSLSFSQCSTKGISRSNDKSKRRSNSKSTEKKKNK